MPVKTMIPAIIMTMNERHCECIMNLEQSMQSTILSFYDRDAISLPCSDADIVALESLGASLLSRDEARQIPFIPLFSYHAESYTGHALPIGTQPTLVVPGALIDHESLFVDNVSIRTAIEEYVRENLDGEKYLLLLRKGFFHVLKLREFSYSVFVHSNTFPSGVVLIDATQKVQICFEDDLEITMLMRAPPAIEMPQLLGRGLEYWNLYFKEYFPKIIVPHQAHMEFYNMHYAPQLPAIGRLEFPPGTKVIS